MAFLRAARSTSGAHSFKSELLASVCFAALFLGGALGSSALAAEYLVNNESELRAAILSANADPDSTATIILTSNIVMASSTTLNTPSKPITINTGGFTITGESGALHAALYLQDSGASDVFTLEGTLLGGNAVSGPAGIGLMLRTGVSAINNGLIVGGDSPDGEGVAMHWARRSVST